MSNGIPVRQAAAGERGVPVKVVTTRSGIPVQVVTAPARGLAVRLATANQRGRPIRILNGGTIT